MEHGFLQSPEWEKIQNLAGRKTWRASGILLIRHEFARYFSYLYCPRPVFKNEPLQEDFFTQIKKIADAEHAVFLKIDPQDSIPEKWHLRVRMVLSPSVQPRESVMMDLSRSEEELLAGMHEKTRYNIRLAEKRGVEVSKVLFEDLDRDFEIFWTLLRETGIRNTFFLHKKEYYQTLFQAQSNLFSNELFFAVVKGKVLAAALVNFYQPSGMAVYLHGASSRDQKELMAPHLLHWRIIQEVKKRGLKGYDFWGIDEQKWPGVTRFKLGFSGKRIAYPPSIDILYKPWRYKGYRFYKAWKKLLRR